MKNTTKLVRFEDEVFRITSSPDKFPTVEVFTDGKFVSAGGRPASFIWEVMGNAPALSPEEAAKLKISLPKVKTN